MHLGQKNKKPLGQEMSEDVWSREKWPICFPAWSTMHIEHALCHMSISCWRDMKKSLIPPRLVYSGSGFSVPTSGLHYFLPTPISLYLRKHFQKTRFPKIASSLKVSCVFNSDKKKKKVKSCWPRAALVGDPVPQFTIHFISTITKTTNREQPH